MANEFIKLVNFTSGTITNNPLASGGTTLTSAELANLAAPSSAQFIPIILNPLGDSTYSAAPEVVWVTAKPSSTSATIVRGREGTSDIQHASGTPWCVGGLVSQVTTIGAAAGEPSGGGLPYEGQKYVDGTNDRIEHYSGSAWARTGHYTSAGRTGGIWTRASNQSINNATLTTVTFTAETADSDGYLTPTSGTATVPSGLAGYYAYDFRYTWSGAPGTTGTAVLLNGAVRVYQQNVASTTNGITGVFLLAATDTLAFQVIQNSGGALNITEATLNFYRIGV